MFSPIMAASSQRYLLSRVNSGITVGHGGGILPLKLHEAVDAAQLLVQLRILTHYQAGFLIVFGAGGVQSGFRHLLQLGFGNLFRAKAADGVTGEHFFNGGVHAAFLL